jgi:hypothetical protein
MDGSANSLAAPADSSIQSDMTGRPPSTVPISDATETQSTLAQSYVAGLQVAMRIETTIAPLRKRVDSQRESGLEVSDRDEGLLETYENLKTLCFSKSAEDVDKLEACNKYLVQEDAYLSEQEKAAADTKAQANATRSDNSNP